MAKKLVTLIFPLLFHIAVFAQSEYISVNSTKDFRLKSEENTPVLLKSLPFFDDFAYPYHTPLSTLWKDADVYVNTAFAKNEITIGVASLDAMAGNGKLHENVSTTSTISDYLTSRPINLKTYELMYYSDKLYRHVGESFQLLDENYFLFDSEKNEYVPVTQGIAYRAGDTLYNLSADVYTPVQDSLFDENHKYIKGSRTTEHVFYNYELADSLALSFYYQSGGVVDTPEATDSLVLEFYVPYDTSGIFINEMSSAGIELYNATDTVLSLKGYFLIFSPLETLIEKDSLKFFQLSDGTIDPYHHYFFTPEQFSMQSFTKTYAYLYSPDTVCVDSIDLQQKLSQNVVYARLTDGNPVWSYTAIETLGDCNPSWQWVWSTSKATGDTFVPQFVPLNSQEYLVKGFRFRFKNYTSLSNDVSHARNEDFWHLDVVLLDAHRTAKNLQFPDVAFTKNITPLYSRYKALPMSHFSQVTANDFRLTIPSSFKNFDSDYRKVKFNFAVKGLHKDDEVAFTTYEADIPANTLATERDILTDFDVDFYDFIADDIDVYESGQYEFQYYFTDKNNPLYTQYHWNDTCRVLLTLANYYAYDDGSPEAGYGLRDAPMGRVAYKYDILQKDTLHAISMYFNPTMLENAVTFNLCVWANDNGYPGELLYYSPSEKVQYAEGMYQFVDYEIKPENIVSGEKNLIVEKSFFVGWEQPHDVLLNVGIDLNASLSNRLYYNLGFEWENSVQTGALLMRPVFGKFQSALAVEPVTDNQSVVIYPSVADNVVHVDAETHILSVAVYDMNGQKVLETASSELSVSALQNGYYVVVVRTSQAVVAKQIIVLK